MMCGDTVGMSVLKNVLRNKTSSKAIQTVGTYDWDYFWNVKNCEVPILLIWVEIQLLLMESNS